TQCTTPIREGKNMLSYFYKWTPLFIVGTICILSLPWLGLIALMIVALVVLPAIAWVIVYVPYRLGRAIRRGWQGHRPVHPRAAVAPSVATGQPGFRKGHAS